GEPSLGLGDADGYERTDALLTVAAITSHSTAAPLVGTGLALKPEAQRREPPRRIDGGDQELRSPPGLAVDDVEVLHHHEHARANAVRELHGDEHVGDIVLVLRRYERTRRKRLGHPEPGVERGLARKRAQRARRLLAARRHDRCDRLWSSLLG